MLEASFKPFVSTDDNKKRTEHKNMNKKSSKDLHEIKIIWRFFFRLDGPKIKDWKITKIIDGENESLLTYSRLINRCRLFASHQFPFHSQLQL